MTFAHKHIAELFQELMLECEEISFSECCITIFLVTRCILLANSMLFPYIYFDELYLFSYKLHIR